MRAKTYATEQEARDEIAVEDAHRGFPRSKQGTRVGGGRHVASITTTTCAVPVELDDGRWGVPVKAFTAPSIDVSGAADVEPKKADPTTVAGGATPSGKRDVGTAPVRSVR